MKKISKWLKGYVQLETTGWGSDRLINILKRNNITLHYLKTVNDGYSFSISAKDYKKFKLYNEKISANVKIVDKNGLPYYFHKYRKRKIFILCFLLFILGIFIFSNYIWNITIIGNEAFTKEELLKDIEDNFVSTGTSKKSLDCNTLEKELRAKYNNIAWISCQIKGTNLIISIKETIPIEEPITYTSPCNIVAYKDALITDIIVNKGQKVATIGNQVKKNDILITGVVNIHNQFDELIETSYTSAQGTVYGIVEYNYFDEINLQNTIKSYTGNESSQYNINAINNILNLPHNNKYRYYDTISTTKNLRLFDNLYLPLGFGKTTYKEYTIENVTYNSEEASKILKNRLVEYIDKLKKKGVSILENNVTISTSDGICKATGTIKCKEAIGVPSNIEIIKEGEQ